MSDLELSFRDSINTIDKLKVELERKEKELAEKNGVNQLDCYIIKDDIEIIKEKLEYEKKRLKKLEEYLKKEDIEAYRKYEEILTLI